MNEPRSPQRPGQEVAGGTLWQLLRRHALVSTLVLVSFVAMLFSYFQMAEGRSVNAGLFKEREQWTLGLIDGSCALLHFSTRDYYEAFDHGPTRWRAKLGDWELHAEYDPRASRHPGAGSYRYENRAGPFGSSYLSVPLWFAWGVFVFCVVALSYVVHLTRFLIRCHYEKKAHPDVAADKQVNS